MQLSTVRWRLYPLKGDELLDLIYIHRQSAYLIGRDSRVGAVHAAAARDGAQVADIPLAHPSVSSQHAGEQPSRGNIAYSYSDPVPFGAGAAGRQPRHARQAVHDRPQQVCASLRHL